MFMKLIPIEKLIFDGLTQKLTSLFGAPALISMSNDRRKIVERTRQGKEVKYPQMLVLPKGYEENVQSLNKFYLSRYGMDSFFENSGNRYRVRLKPTLLHFEVVFITNDSGFSEKLGIQDFAKKWLFAKDLGNLKFDINYGSLKVSVHLDLDGNVSFQESESVDQGPKEYHCSVNLTVQGYISDPHLALVGTVTEVEQDQNVTSHWSFSNDSNS